MCVATRIPDQLNTSEILCAVGSKVVEMKARCCCVACAGEKKRDTNDIKSTIKFRRKISLAFSQCHGVQCTETSRRMLVEIQSEQDGVRVSNQEVGLGGRD